MSVTVQEITIPSADGGAIPVSLAVPSGAAAPALVLVPSIFGVDDDVRETARDLASRGYIAAAIDPFWRLDPGPLNRNVDDEKQRAFARNEAFDRDAGVRDIAAVRDALLQRGESNGTWALVGYCFGGRYALIAGADLGADAVVAFHPSKMGLELEAAARVSCPTSFHFGGADASVPMSEVDAVQNALKNNPHAESFVYEGVGHGYTGKTAPSYNAKVTRESLERALTVLERLKTPAGVA